jgi:hypothetical protein
MKRCHDGMQTNAEQTAMHLHLRLLLAQRDLLRLRQLSSQVAGVARLLLPARRRTHLRPLLRPFRPASRQRQNRALKTDTELVGDHSPANATPVIPSAATVILSAAKNLPCNRGSTAILRCVYPGRVRAISRWLSAATPPGRMNKAPQRPRKGRSHRLRAAAVIPSAATVILSAAKHLPCNRTSAAILRPLTPEGFEPLAGG